MLIILSSELLREFIKCSHYNIILLTCKTETLGSLYSHALLILTKSPKFQNQVVHEQKFNDLLSRKCPDSLERIVLDLDSEVHLRPGFNTHWG